MPTLSADHRGRTLVVPTLTLMLGMVLAAGCAGKASDGATPATVPVSATAPAEPTPGGTLRFGLAAETPSGWDPANSLWASSGEIVSRAVFDRLMAVDRDGAVVPDLARSLVPSEDFSTWTITLRPGISFHNGQPLDAEAVGRNLENLRASSITGGTPEGDLHVTVVDDLTLRIDLGAPWSTLPAFLASQGGAMAAPEQLDAAIPSEHPIGTGPFAFESWSRDQSLTVVRNPHYWRTDAAGRSLPYLDRVEFVVVADPASRAAGAGQGDIDVFQTTDAPEIQRFETLARQGELQIQTNESDEAEAQIIAMNTATTPFDAPLARELFVSLVDTTRISEELYLGLFPVATGLFPPSSPDYAATTYPGYDPDRARELSARYRDQHGRPLHVVLDVPTTGSYRALGEAIQEQARQVGVEVELDVVLEAELVTDAVLGNYQATAFVTFGQPFLDAVLVTGETVAPVGQMGLNLARFHDPVIDDALRVQRSSGDPAVQAEQWKIVQDRMARNLAYLFVVRTRAAVVSGLDTFGLQGVLPDGQLAPITTTPSLAMAWTTEH